MSETKNWGHNPDTWMVGLTFILMLVGGYTAWIFYGQFGEMKSQTAILNQQAKQASADSVEATRRVEQQLDISRQQVSAAQASVKAVQRQMRQDQRPWLSMAFNWPAVKAANNQELSVIQFTENQPVTVPLKYSNNGKTAARNIIGGMFVEVVKSGDAPKLDSKNVPPFGFTAGVLFPGPTGETFVIRQGANGKNDPLTPLEKEDLTSNRAYIAVYGKILYDDIFSVRHWTKFCFWLPLSAAPSSYNAQS